MSVSFFFLCLMLGLYSYKLFGLLCSWLYSAVNALWRYMNQFCLNKPTEQKGTGSVSLLLIPSVFIMCNFFFHFFFLLGGVWDFSCFVSDLRKLKVSSLFTQHLTTLTAVGPPGPKAAVHEITRPIKGSIFWVWSRSEYSLTCFPCRQESCLS